MDYNIDKFKEQQKKAQIILDDVVRPQVEYYEKMLKTKNSSMQIKLNSAQKTHVDCKPLL